METTSGFTSARVRLATGVELHYVEAGPSDGAEVVLFLHGWPDSWFSFSRVLAAPKAAGLRALVPDQRGFGDSERPEGGYTIDDLAEDAAAFLDALGVFAVTVVGHSMGSFVARRLAESHPGRVRRLVLIGTAAHAGNETVTGIAAQVAGVTDPVPEELVRELQAGTAVRPLPAEFLDGVVAEGAKAPAHVWQQVLAGLIAFDDSADVGSIGAATLVVAGAEDPLFSVEEHETVADAIPGSRLTLYPGTGHRANWEDPERVAADLAALLRR